MGSEMCIRDSGEGPGVDDEAVELAGGLDLRIGHLGELGEVLLVCLLYTSDAADERSSVDLGGRRIIKKKKK